MGKKTVLERPGRVKDSILFTILTLTLCPSVSALTAEPFELRA